MDFILSLAHFCEKDGPTTVLCTQILQEACATCQPCNTPVSDLSSSYNDSSYWNSASLNHQTTSFDTPPTSPTSPRRGSNNPYFPSLPSDEDLRAGFGSHADCEACDNCTFTVPKSYCERLPEGAPGSPTKDRKGRNGSPVLRTSGCILVPGTPVTSDDESESSAPGSYKQAGFIAPTPPSSTASPLIPRDMHTHNLTCITTHQPTSPAAYSVLRRSCLRALSGVNLPRGSSGSFMVGDPFAGNQVSYVFRVPDPNARGHRRTYALIAHGGRDCWDTTKAMKYIVQEFEEIAHRIITAADRALERASRPSTAIMVTPPASTGTSASAVPPSPRTLTITPVSSFLSAKRVDPDGYPRGSREVSHAKTLAQIVANESFFVELHGQFCRILAQLVRSSSN